jgi:hypothetical protein
VWRSDMTQYELTNDVYISVTAAGAFHATSQAGNEPSRRLLKNLLLLDTTPALDPQGLTKLSCIDDEEEAMNLLFHIQGLGWVSGLSEPQRTLPGSLDEILPDLLGSLSVSGKALLADDQGFYISAQQFPHEVAEELSALSADIASLHDRRKKLLGNNLGLGTSTWALVDAAGNSQLGFWPLYVGASRFVLVLGGEPRLNQSAFAQLVWALSVRYGESESEIEQLQQTV